MAYDTRNPDYTQASLTMITPFTHLGDLSVDQFMTDCWHKKPRLFRQAIADFEPLCDLETIEEMASDEDIESRLIQQQGQNWSLEKGPFEQLPSLDRKHWTVLIQGIDHHLPEAYDLLQRFRFLPDARLDDVMLSLASDQGGVGPHFDSYDVFLLQMHGTRKWRIGPLVDASLQENMPLKILKNFQATEEFLLEPGDMLYLPPNYGHDGTAQGTCTTLSIGFRAPTKAEVLSGVLRDLADQVDKDPALCNSLFADPDQLPTSIPAEIPQSMLEFGHVLMQQFSPQSGAIGRSMGLLLSEPKPHVYFVNNTEDLEPDEIVQVLSERGVALSMKTKMLYSNGDIFINGDVVNPKEDLTVKQLQMLANRRELEPEAAAKALKNPELRYFLIGFAKAGWVETLV